MSLFSRRYRPSLMHNVKWGAKLGIFFTVVFAFLLWYTGLQYNEVDEEIFNQQFQKMVDALDDRKLYHALVQMWNLGSLICHPYFLLAGMIIGVLLGIKKYMMEKQHQRLQRQRQLQILRQHGGTSKNYLVLFFTTIFGAISTVFYLVYNKLKKKKKQD